MMTKKTLDQIDHNLVILSDDEKFPYLLNTLQKKKDSKTVIFCNGPFNIALVSQWLGKADIKTEKATRDTKNFFEEASIVVCDDSTLRNLADSQADFVINYELPKRSGNYLDRVSKAKDDSGQAVSLCGYRDCESLDSIEDHFNLKISRQYVEDVDLATEVPEQPALDPADFKRTREKRPRDNDRKDRGERKERSASPRERSEKTHNNKESKMNQTQSAPRERKPMIPTKFTIATSSKSEAYNQALAHFKLDDKSKLNTEIIAQGPKKFLFFGAQETTYEFTYSSGHRAKIEPFLKQLLEMMHVKLTYRIEEDPKNFKVHLEGDDLGLVLNNRKQLMFAIDSLLRQFVIKRVNLPKGIRVSVYAEGTHQKDRKPGQRGPGNRPDGRNRRPKKVVDENGLNKLAQGLKNEVMETGSSQRTETLHPAERRIIHQFFEEEANFTTTSIGDGRFKRIEVSIVNQ